MSDQDDTQDAPPGPAERSLATLLAPLRAEEPAGELSARGVVRRARWQRTVRAALQAVGSVAASTADGARVVFGAGAKRGPR